MTTMQVWNETLFYNYRPSIETMRLGMKVTEKLGKLCVRMSTLFIDYKMPSRIFAFIESKFSNQIENIYTTLYDVVNTNDHKTNYTTQPIVRALFDEEQVIDYKFLIKISDAMSVTLDKAKRFSNEFGIYQGNDKNKTKIYQPPIEKDEIDRLLRRVIAKANDDANIVDVIHTHILFEKIHPFVDGNGRIGRLILQRSIAKLINFGSVLPISWSFFKNNAMYYNAFDIRQESDLDNGVQNILMCILKMYETTKNFIQELTTFYTFWREKFHELGLFKMDEDLGKDIILTLQTKTSFLIKTRQLDPRTIKSMFAKIQAIGFDMNARRLGREKLFWNIELESLIEKHYG